MSSSESSPLRLVTAANWHAIGKKLFGNDHMAWRFKCPSCGHIQSKAELLKRHPDAKVPNGFVYSSCEGRLGGKVGCDWTLGGLFQIHRVAVFEAESHSLLPVFAFAHADADAELAAHPYTPPPRQTTEAKTWAEWTWPEWVPAETRARIENFWSSKYGRSPQSWLGSSNSHNAPPLGTRVKMNSGLGETAHEVEGRYVHCQNNAGCVVRDDGSVAFVWI